MKQTDTLKPRDMWERDEHLDFLDGWHEASDIGFRVQRDPERAVVFHDPAAPPRQDDQILPGYQSVATYITANRLTHPASMLHDAGKAARAQHREDTGL